MIEHSFQAIDILCNGVLMCYIYLFFIKDEKNFLFAFFAYFLVLESGLSLFKSFEPTTFRTVINILFIYFGGKDIIKELKSGV